LRDVNDFIELSVSGAPDIFECAGLNFPRTMTPAYRAVVVAPVVRWLDWALAFHLEGRLNEVPTHVDCEIAAIRIGDVGILCMSCEPFSMIGRKVKAADTGFPLVITCGYMNNDTIAYVPNSSNNGDREYMSAYYRYTTNMMPYRNPAGDRLAADGTRLLDDLWQRQ
jgi:hypothetical protein